MKFYLLEPEVAGSISDSEGDWSLHPPVIEKLCYKFEGWLGTEILTSFPIFMVTDALKLELESIEATGCQFATVKIKTSPQFKRLYSKGAILGLTASESLPKFHWLKPTGTLLQDDFAQAGLEKGFRLAVSQRVWDVMQKHNLTDCLIEEL